MKCPGCSQALSFKAYKIPSAVSNHFVTGLCCAKCDAYLGIIKLPELSEISDSMNFLIEALDNCNTLISQIANNSIPDEKEVKSVSESTKKAIKISQKNLAYIKRFYEFSHETEG